MTEFLSICDPRADEPIIACRAPPLSKGAARAVDTSRAMDLIAKDLRPRQIMTAAAFRNAVRVAVAIGASVNAADDGVVERPLLCSWSGR
jgi:dihydroxy-acid dehydratase